MDPNKFDQPNGIQLDGNKSKHLVFGHGIHQCIGMSIVRMQLKAMTALIVPQIQNFERLDDDETITNEDSAILNPLTFLKVRHNTERSA